MGSVLKMRITGYSDGTFSTKLGSYDAMINPEKLVHNRTIEYNSQQAPDKSQPSVKYKLTPASNLSFDLVLDCTGVVDGKRMDLSDEIDRLKSLIYEYKSDIHRPAFVQLQWGLEEPFKGVLTQFNTTYSLFKSDGIPLRATISLAFTSYLDPKRIAKEENRNSPDLTHLVEVVKGDTLPSLSLRIYNSSDYFVQLATFNGLDKFRRLQPGRQLTFPPLISPEEKDTSP